MRAPGKYGNIATEIDGTTFASRKEARRYGELKLLEHAGEITGLKLHPAFPLDVNGKPVCRYEGDFEYRTKGGERVVEDVKSEATRKNRAYRIKNKLFAALLGFEIREV